MNEFHWATCTVRDIYVRVIIMDAVKFLSSAAILLAPMASVVLLCL